MNLKEIRKSFINLSGRDDLVLENGDDRGADFYINEGQKYLDRLVDYPGEARVFQSLSNGQVYAKFKNCRVIREVWVSKADSRVKLTRKDLVDIRQFYAYPLTGVDYGQPLYYAPAVLRASPEIDTLTNGELTALQAQYGVEDVITTVNAANHEYSGIVLMPPASIDWVTLEVFGLFYSRYLESNTDRSWWSVNHPMTLVHAALLMLELSYRNTAGANDWLNAIKLVTDGVEKDFLETEIMDVTEIEI